MNRGITVALTLIALALVAFLVFVEPQLKSTRAHKNAGGWLLEIIPDQIQTIKIATGDQTIELKKRDSGWKITKPIKDLASKEAVEKILKAAQNVKILDEISDAELRKSDRKLRDFGLANSRQSLELAGDQKIKLIFGKDAAGEKRVYIRRDNSDDAYIVGNALQEAAFRNLDDFRDKHLTDLHSDQITSFVIRRAGGELELKRIANRWEIVKPLQSAADPVRVKEFLDRILGVEILKIVSNETTPQNTTTTPDTTVELVLRPENADGKDVVLRVGSRVADNPQAVIAELSSRSSTYELPKSVAETLNVLPAMFRDKALVRLNADVIDRILIQKNGAVSELKRKENDWVTTSEGREISVSNASVAKLASFLGEIPIERFIPAGASDLQKYGLDKPSLTVKFQAWLSENTPEEGKGAHDLILLEFGKQEGDKLYARRDGSAEILVLPAGIVAFIEGGPDAWNTVSGNAKGR
ncbi:MAG: DUF4340 domain-containing protein [Chthoniobacterales bacterium]